MSKEKEMIKTNKAVSVYFTGYKSQAAYIACIFSSSLFNDGPIGGAFCGVNYDNSNRLKHLRYIFPNPKDINGTYTFNYSALFLTLFQALQFLP